MPRLFTAIELDDAVRTAVAARQRELQRTLQSAGIAPPRMLRSEQLHLTLVFLGDVDAARVPAVEAAMRTPLALDPFALAFGRVGVFPPTGPARVLWLGVERGAGDVRQLFDVVGCRLEGIGIPRERRPFSPHLTLGRWGDRGPSGVVTGESTRSTIPSQHVAAVTLFASRLLPAGAEHTVLARAPLAGATGRVH